MKDFIRKFKTRDRASKQFRAAIWIVVVLLIVVIYFSVSSMKKKTGLRSHADVSNVSAPSDTKSGYTGQSSQEFNNALVYKGKQDAAKARQEGRSFITPMDNAPTTGDKDKINDVLKVKAKRHEKKVAEQELKPRETQQPPPKQETEQKAPPRTVRTAKQVEDDKALRETINASLKAQLDLISRKRVYKPHKVMTYSPIEDPTATVSVAQAAAENQTQTAKAPFNMVRDLGVNPGDVFYAANRETLNTDTPAPVATVKILSGPKGIKNSIIKDSIAEGTFELAGDSIRFTFYQLTTKNGDIYAMKGFAVNPQTKFAGVASEVDHHYLSRWGGLFASSFLKGYAAATAKSGTASSTNVAGGIITSENPEYDLKEKFWIASGEVADALGDAAKANFNRAATAWLRSNDPVGVLIISLEPIN